MKLTKSQIAFIENERDIIEKIIESEPRKGLIIHHTKWHMLNMMIALHNVAVKEEKDGRKAG